MKKLLLAILLTVSANTFASEEDVIDNVPEIVMNITKDYVISEYPNSFRAFNITNTKTKYVFHTGYTKLRVGQVIKYTTVNDENFIPILSEVHVYEFSMDFFKN